MPHNDRHNLYLDDQGRSIDDRGNRVDAQGNILSPEAVTEIDRRQDRSRQPIERKEVLTRTKETGDYWETIQQWRIDEGKNFARSRGSAIARMAAGGMRAGSEQWQANLAKIDADNAAEKSSQTGSATQGILDRWVDQMKEFYIQAEGGPKDRWLSTDNWQGDRWVLDQNSEYAQLQESGQSNPYTDSGLGAEEFRNMSTDDFMEAQFGQTEGYDEFLAGDSLMVENRAKEDEQNRQTAANAVTQRSPWWDR